MENGEMTPQEAKAAKAGAELMTQIFLLKREDDVASRAMFHSIEDTYYDKLSDDFDLMSWLECRLEGQPPVIVRAWWCTLGDMLAKNAGIDRRDWWKECSEMAETVERRTRNDEGK